MKCPYTVNGTEPNFSMPQVNVLTMLKEEAVFRGAPILTEMFGLGLAKCFVWFGNDMWDYFQENKNIFFRDLFFIYLIPLLNWKHPFWDTQSCLREYSSDARWTKAMAQVFRLPWRIFRETEMLFFPCIWNQFLQVKKKYLLFLFFISDVLDDAEVVFVAIGIAVYSSEFWIGFLLNNLTEFKKAEKHDYRHRKNLYSHCSFS